MRSRDLDITITSDIDLTRGSSRRVTISHVGENSFRVTSTLKFYSCERHDFVRRYLVRCFGEFVFFIGNCSAPKGYLWKEERSPILTGLQRELADAGYCVNGNSSGLPGVPMYPSGPGIREPSDAPSVSVHVLPQLILVYDRAKETLLAQFESVVEYFSWCPAICEGGQLGHEENWD